MIGNQIEVKEIHLNEDFPISFVRQAFQEGPYTFAPHILDTFEIGYCHNGQGVF